MFGGGGAGFSPAETNAIWNANHPSGPLDKIRRRHPFRYEKARRDVVWLEIMFQSYRSVMGYEVDVAYWIAKKNRKRWAHCMQSLAWLDAQLIRHGAMGLF